MMRVHLVARGGVQGVGYRFTMEAVAARVGATGWVRNRPDGSVEAEVEGSDAAVADVVDWARRGPRGGWVDDVQVEQIAPEGSGVFEIRRDG
ncbi:MULTISPECIES: acylphosphatase [Microbacterium]|uniref:acylphosphatase n=1 Tax=Microbacterium hominis TaxID=162426 RepID=A0A2K9DNV4_9MICO|nr:MULTISPECIES: acylphosphatase [Microbacterium]AUG28846.1 acylphosphatase [Microbacterium hominis]QOC24589.1 acylphosphatase [Microbacterium hominis]QOC28653.1 acylphosphatase [Microbacterium hominis]QYF99112.1 acylphosphatase [Microbacterium sp. PAMC21962]